MPHYVTTNLRLSKEMLKRLKMKSIEKEKSVSQLIREAIEACYFGHEKLKKRDVRTDPMTKIIGMARSGIKDGSVAHDVYLYGDK